MTDEKETERRLVRTRLVGRQRELALLRQTMDRSLAEQACHVVTLLGVPGVGKTRLMAAFLDDLPDGTTVLRGRCLPYGDAIGLWPLREVVRTAADAAPGTDDEALRERLAALLGADADGAAVADRLGVLAGRSGATPTKDETAWAVRRLLEAIGRRRPVVVVIDDVHWADPVLVDVLDHLADWVRDASLLLVCVSRPELLDARPTWGGGRVNATSLLLSPLGPDDTADLVSALAGDADVAPDVAARVMDASAGVPLYAEHLFAMLVEEGRVALAAGTWTWTASDDSLDAPPTIAAILATRLEHLDRVSRSVLEAASVIGEVFYRDAVVELLDDVDEGAVGSALTTLLRRQLVRPDVSDIAGEDAMRFVHVLVQDVTYNAVSKARRADLHLRLARWLAKRVDAGEGVDAFVGHHLAAAVLLRDEVGTRDEETREVAAEAIQVLRRAASRVDARDPSRCRRPARPRRSRHRRTLRAGGAALPPAAPLPQHERHPGGHRGVAAGTCRSRGVPPTSVAGWWSGRWAARSPSSSPTSGSSGCRTTSWMRRGSGSPRPVTTRACPPCSPRSAIAGPSGRSGEKRSRSLTSSPRSRSTAATSLS